MPVVLSDAAKGVTVTGRLVRHNQGVGYHIAITNAAAAAGPLDGFLLQTNRNAFGLTPSNQVVAIASLAPDATGHAVVPLTCDAGKVAPGPPAATLQVRWRRHHCRLPWGAPRCVCGKGGRQRAQGALRPWLLANGQAVARRVAPARVTDAVRCSLRRRRLWRRRCAWRRWRSRPTSRACSTSTTACRSRRCSRSRAPSTVSAKRVSGGERREPSTGFAGHRVDALGGRLLRRSERCAVRLDRCAGATFLSTWKALPPETQQRLPGTLVASMEAAKAKLQAASLFVLAHRPVRERVARRGRRWGRPLERMTGRIAEAPMCVTQRVQVPGSSQEALYITGRVTGPAGAQIMLELRIVPGQQGVDASFKSERADLAPLAFDAVAAVLA